MNLNILIVQKKAQIALIKTQSGLSHRPLKDPVMRISSSISSKAYPILLAPLFRKTNTKEILGQSIFHMPPLKQERNYVTVRR